MPHVLLEIKVIQCQVSVKCFNLLFASFSNLFKMLFWVFFSLTELFFSFALTLGFSAWLRMLRKCYMLNAHIKDSYVRELPELLQNPFDLRSEWKDNQWWSESNVIQNFCPAFCTFPHFKNTCFYSSIVQGEEECYNVFSDLLTVIRCWLFMNSDLINKAK